MGRPDRKSAFALAPEDRFASAVLLALLVAFAPLDGPAALAGVGAPVLAAVVLSPPSLSTLRRLFAATVPVWLGLAAAVLASRSPEAASRLEGAILRAFLALLSTVSLLGPLAPSELLEGAARWGVPRVWLGALGVFFFSAARSRERWPRRRRALALRGLSRREGWSHRVRSIGSALVLALDSGEGVRRALLVRGTAPSGSGRERDLRWFPIFLAYLLLFGGWRALRWFGGVGG
jgi:hypothetical protein